MLGYRVMRYEEEGPEAISGADSRVRVSLIPGMHHTYPGVGMFLTPHRDYAVENYAVHDRNVLLCYEFDENKITSGCLVVEAPEISVQTAQLVSYELLRDEDD